MSTAHTRLAGVFFEPSTTLLLLGDVLLLILACYRSQSFSLAVHEQVAQEAENSPINVYAAVVIPIAGSVMLLALFFFLDKMFYFLVVLFGLSAFTSMMMFVHPTVVQARRYLFPRLAEEQTFSIRGRSCRLPVFDLLVCGACAGLVVAGWLLTYHWVFVDLLAVALAVQAIATLRLPNLMVSTLLLCVFFVYDVFWVFISPLIFGKSVMVEVAIGVTSGSIPLPMLILVPKFLSSGNGLLGLGDIVLPGIVLAYLFRCDFTKATQIAPNRRLRLTEVLAVDYGYFVPCLCGYAIGLVVTFAALAIMQLGQPALLYLVPSTLGTALVLAAKRGELAQMWRQKAPEREPEETSSDEEAPGGQQETDVEMQRVPVVAEEDK
jgi:signal peptide peptidase-like protein 2B